MSCSLKYLLTETIAHWLCAWTEIFLTEYHTLTPTLNELCTHYMLLLFCFFLTICFLSVRTWNEIFTHWHHCPLIPPWLCAHLPFAECNPYSLNHYSLLTSFIFCTHQLTDWNPVSLTPDPPGVIAYVIGARPSDACGGASGGDQPEGDAHHQAEGRGQATAGCHQLPQQGHRRQGHGHTESAQGPQGTVAVSRTASEMTRKAMRMFGSGLLSGA